jgi:hypothetical protein
MQNENRVFDILFRALAYILGGMFLVVTSSTLGQVIGWIFIGFAFLLVVMASMDTRRFSSLVNLGNNLFGVGLFVATVTRVLFTTIQTHETSYLVLAIVFGVLIIFALSCQIYRTIKARCRKKSAPKP